MFEIANNEITSTLQRSRLSSDISIIFIITGSYDPLNISHDQQI